MSRGDPVTSYRAVGIPPGGAPRRNSLAERFFSLTIPEPNSGCLLWTGSIGCHGYGRIGVDGATKSATHIALQLADRPLPDGMHACHICDNPSCVNEAHLFHGTPKTNKADSIDKNRAIFPRKSFGEKNGRSKLDAEAVLSIRKELERGRSAKSIAREFGITNVHVGDIKHRKCWKHL